MEIDEEVDLFLEHFGTKGMKWGVRTKSIGKEANRSRKDKAKIAGVGVASFIIARQVTSHLNTPLSIAAGAASAGLGVRVARNLIDAKGGKLVKDI